MLCTKTKTGKVKPPILAGLTASETAEFRELGKVLRTKNEALAKERDARWIELYLKHEASLVCERLRGMRTSCVLDDDRRNSRSRLKS